MSHYMRPEERQQLEALHRAKVPIGKIAEQLGFCRQTIWKELKLGAYVHDCGWYDEVRYSADKAGQIHQETQTAKGRPLKIGNNRAYADYLEGLMLGKQPDGRIDKRKRFSPAAALAAARKLPFRTNICVTTLYSYIGKRVFLHLTNRDLWEKSKQKKRDYEPVQRIAHPLLPCITQRPDYINSREEAGHYEMDLVVSCEKGSGGLLTMTDRAGRCEIIRKIPNKQARTIRKALRGILEAGYIIRSITTDNGSEFLEYDKLLEVTGCPVYYCHSFAAWEKGTNENHNRMIRRWFPKGTDFSKISTNEIAECEDWMNNYPRKSLGWLTPREFMNLAA